MKKQNTMAKKKVTRRILVAVVAAMFSLSLVGCGSSGTATTAEPKKEEATTSSTPLADPISFVKEGEIYFDNKLGDSVTISVDGQKVDGKTAAFKKGVSISLDGLDPDGKTNYVVVYMNKGDNLERCGAFVGKGANNSMVSELLTKKLNLDVVKVCVCLFKHGDTWNKDLSEGMNKLIEGYMPADTLDN
jgi:curli biogenesis system outer membrane secretion channel CsgG